jgi:3'(2'),5'-bisphosphate nucleotidase
LETRHLQQELDVAVRLAHQAGTVIMGYFRTDLIIEHKAGDEPVTIADRAADDLIRTGLQAAFPHDGLLTEESEDDFSRLEKERVWIVDPLDGTSDFVAGTGDFVVQIALAIRGYPSLGVIYHPVDERLFFAVRGEGAFMALNGQCQRLRVSLEANPTRMCLIASRSHYSAFVQAAREALAIQTVRHMGSVGLKVSQVARGTCDLYLATNVAKEWDICAPHTLLLEAGGKLTNLCGEHITYNRPEVIACRGIIGSNDRVHTQIVATLAPLVSSMLEERQ